MAYRQFAVAWRVLFPPQYREGAMKVGTVERKEPGKPAEAGAFKKAFAQSRRPAQVAAARVNPAPRTLPTHAAGPAKARSSGPVGAGRVAVAPAAPREALSTARKGMNAEAARLGAVRTEAHTAHSERLDARLIDVICRELAVEFASDDKSAGQPQARVAAAEASRAAPAPSLAQAPAAGTSPRRRPPSRSNRRRPARPRRSNSSRRSRPSSGRSGPPWP